MKKSIIALVFALLAALAVQANPVDRATAVRVGTTFMRAHGLPKDAVLVDVTAKTPFTLFYVLTTGGDNFVLVSADDCVRPILGYSLDSPFRCEAMPDHVADWFRGYEAQIAGARDRAVQRGRLGLGSSRVQAVADEWVMLDGGVMPPEPLTAQVAPLMTTKWDQAPRYNNLCPEDNQESSYYNRRVVAGCVATATAQIMKYHNHPDTGYSSHSYTHSKYGTLSADFGQTGYDWANMPNQLGYSSTSAQIEAVATLIYHVGVADEMNYGLSYYGGSSAQNYNTRGEIDASTQTSLMRYFKYSPLLYVLGREDFDPDTWDGLLRDELEAGRPLLFSGRSASAGHSFVCDGYNQSGMFHINWGWGGSNDGYFPMGGLDPSTSGIGGNSESSYNLQNAVLFGIEPDTNWGGGGTVSVSATAGGVVSGGGSYSQGDAVELYASANSGYRFKGWSDGARYNPRGMVLNGGDYGFEAVFEPLSHDTLGYCANGHRISSLGTQGTYRWGIRIPSSAIEAGRRLRAVEFYACAAGNYTVMLHTGTTSPSTLIYSSGVTIGQNDINQWYTATLDSMLALDPSLDLWIELQADGSKYPAAVTYGCGNNYGLCSGNSMSYGGWKGFSFMIRGLTDGTFFQQGDTLSYCGTEKFDQGWYYNNHQFEWGIMLPPTTLGIRNKVKAVQFYVDAPAAYEVKIMQGGTGAPQSELLAVADTVNATGWHTLSLGKGVSIDPGEPLWIVLSAPGDNGYPAASCKFTGNANSDWVSENGSDWHHAMADLGNPYSWMIKAVVEYVEPVFYKLTSESADKTMGIASGNGSYLEESEVSVLATPRSGYVFNHWTVKTDSSTFDVVDNPYAFVITSNTVCTAYFDSVPKPETPEDTLGIGAVRPLGVSLRPNPATTTVTVEAAGCDGASVSLIDMQGREVATARTAGGRATVDVGTLPRGIYFVKLTDNAGRSTLTRLALQ
ncbi:MAG: C10 family peptidase [Bacteroidales bacterium]|nr:C10 family peptidase [Bacteroidales bacterium]